LCNTHDDKPCILAGIDGTQEDNIEQAVPIHIDCMLTDVRYNKRVGIVYILSAGYIPDVDED